MSAAVADAESRTQEEVAAASAAMKAAAEAQQLRELEDKVGCPNNTEPLVVPAVPLLLHFKLLWCIMNGISDDHPPGWACSHGSSFFMQVDALQGQLATTTDAQLAAEAALL